MAEQNGAPAGGGQGDGTPPAGGDPLAWAGANLAPEMKGYIENRGWKGPTDVITSYQNYEKLISHDRAGRTIVMPKDDKDEEGHKAFRQKLGVPETADAYKLDIPKEGGDENFAKEAAGKFHELGLTPAQAKGLNAWWNEKVSGLAGAQEQTSKVAFDAERTDLRKSQGAALEQNSAIVDKAAQQFGVDKDTLGKLERAMGPKATFEFLLKIGQGLGEHSFEGAGSGAPVGGKYTPAQAQSRISDLRKDTDFVRRYTAGESAAVREMKELHQMAYPEG